jgi:aminomethyltransferase
MDTPADLRLRQTPLHDAHVELGARMMPFAGFAMPVQYAGIVDEHMAVRRAAGLFDVSHMGEIRVIGSNALRLVQRFITNDASKLYDGRALYTTMCYPDGGIVDDLLVYRLAQDHFMLVVNASNTEKDLAWILDNTIAGSRIDDVSAQTALLAIQGPRAIEIVGRLTDLPVADLKYYHFLAAPEGRFLGCRRAILSRTGYTGEPGLEIYVEAERARSVWDALLDAGSGLGLSPAGLGARDTLRLEAGFPLYGNDITHETNPLEANLGWVVKLEKDDFIGKDALLQIHDRGLRRRLVGFVVEDRGIPRHGYPLLDSTNSEIGVVTSGSLSPVLGRGVGLGYVENLPEFTEPGSRLGIGVRGKRIDAVVARPPFHKK